MMTSREIQLAFDRLGFDLGVADVDQALVDRLAGLAAEVRHKLTAGQDAPGPGSRPGWVGALPGASVVPFRLRRMRHGPRARIVASSGPGALAGTRATRYS